MDDIYDYILFNLFQDSFHLLLLESRYFFRRCGFLSVRSKVRDCPECLVDYWRLWGVSLPRLRLNFINFSSVMELLLVRTIN